MNFFSFAFYVACECVLLRREFWRVQQCRSPRPRPQVPLHRREFHCSARSELHYFLAASPGVCIAASSSGPHRAPPPVVGRFIPYYLLRSTLGVAAWLRLPASGCDCFRGSGGGCSQGFPGWSPRPEFPRGPRIPSSPVSGTTHAPHAPPVICCPRWRMVVLSVVWSSNNRRGVWCGAAAARRLRGGHCRMIRNL